MMASRSEDLNVIPAGLYLQISIPAFKIIPDVIIFVQACFPSGIEMVRLLQAACGYANHWQHNLAGILRGSDSLTIVS